MAKEPTQEMMHQNLGELLEQAATDHARRPFCTFLSGDKLVNITFVEMLEQVQVWADFLRQRGIKPGDRVAFLTPKSVQQTRLFFACWWIGAITVPICEALGDMEMGFIIRDCEPALVVCDRTIEEKVRGSAADCDLMTFSELPVPTVSTVRVPREEALGEDVAALIYTSGSTGMPKGVMLTHRNFLVNAHSAMTTVRIQESDSVISLLPYWHSFALVVEVVCLPMVGARAIIPADKRDFKKNIKRYQPTIILVVPRIADALKTGIERKIHEASPKVKALFDKAIHNASRIFTPGPRLDGGLLRLAAHHTFYDPLVFRKIRAAFGGKLRFFVSGGAPLDIEHQIFFKYIGAPIYQGYGLTEATPVISTNYDDIHRLGSCGQLMPWLLEENGGDWTFLDEKGSVGKEVHGELLVKGDCVMKGYWRHRDQSAKTLAEGWLHTGDMGYVDADGFLFLDGRQGNMIVLVGGEKLHPEHVEDTAKQAELVTECMVIGEKCKNVYACVNVDAELATGLNPAELKDKVRRQVMEKTQHLAPFQRPKDVLILPDFVTEDGTLTVTLKIRRHKVWEHYGKEIRVFLQANGEEIATKGEVGIASSKIMASLGLNGD